MSPRHLSVAVTLGILAQAAFADAAPVNGITLPDRGPFGKRIALTFDDGPHSTRTAAILNVLRRHNAPAIFFVQGKNLVTPAACDRLNEIMASGCLIGNHTKNHPNCARLTTQAFQQEVEACQTAIAQVTGQRPTFFRYPYGAATAATHQVLSDKSLRHVGWSIDTNDWWYAGPKTTPVPGMPDMYRNDFLGWTLRQVEAREGGVMLMHDIHNFTAQNLETLLTALEGRGYRFVRIDDAQTFPNLNAPR